ncbi:NAD(P)H-dependent flavin oxidoreductase [Hymenobacter sp. CRA2]|uniref:NAD(P)H-dependent flavin oxidoreductase n=1 Tax=Hymenobacter sp. CRA2 TaxID=1955620 RepID=UPI00098EE032|nr:nitronate monooxygenase [Hymenobacter sp. CRA2]OON68888.1 hypothetical protein B0919_12025 [Hymenobacter sp. CRA2]
MNWPTELMRRFGIAYPIVQAPMLGVTSPAMVAAVSNAGGLGSLPVGGLSPARAQEPIRQTKALTERPFAVNLFAHNVPTPDVAQATPMQALLAQISQDYGLTYAPQNVTTLPLYTYQAQIEVLVAEQIPVISFTFGLLDAPSIEALHRAGAVLVGTATSVREAELLAASGVDAICAQGIEAGGHRGSFLPDEPLPQVGLLALLPQILRRVSMPVLAAGAIHDGRSIRAALALGAAAVQVGSAFLASDESQAIATYKARVQQATDTSTVLTRAFSGRWARGLPNDLIVRVEQSGLPIPPYPYQNSLTTLLRAAARASNNAELTALWAGQACASARAQPSAAILRHLVEETEAPDRNKVA